MKEAPQARNLSNLPIASRHAGTVRDAWRALFVHEDNEVRLNLVVGSTKRQDIVLKPCLWEHLA